MRDLFSRVQTVVFEFSGSQQVPVTSMRWKMAWYQRHDYDPSHKDCSSSPSFHQKEGSSWLLLLDRWKMALMVFYIVSLQLKHYVRAILLPLLLGLEHWEVGGLNPERISGEDHHCVWMLGASVGGGEAVFRPWLSGGMPRHSHTALPAGSDLSVLEPIVCLFDSSFQDGQPCMAWGYCEEDDT